MTRRPDLDVNVRGSVAITVEVVPRPHRLEVVSPVVVGAHAAAELEAGVVVGAGGVRLPHVELGAGHRATTVVENATADHQQPVRGPDEPHAVGGARLVEGPLDVRVRGATCRRRPVRAGRGR